MLDLKKKYYVSAGARPKSVIARWASNNTMKLIGENLTLPKCGRVYELDVRYNEDLNIASRLLGSGRPNFLNGKRIIGRVCYDTVWGEARVVICPEIVAE